MNTRLLRAIPDDMLMLNADQYLRMAQGHAPLPGSMTRTDAIRESTAFTQEGHQRDHDQETVTHELLTAVARQNNSADGNPRWKITTDAGTRNTKTDAAVGNVVENFQNALARRNDPSRDILVSVRVNAKNEIVALTMRDGSITP